MYRINEIIEALKNVVGWDSEGYALPDSVKQSESGLTFQMAHPLVTISNVQGIMREADPTINDIYLINYPNGGEPSYPVYGAQNTYTKGDKVAYRNAYYIATQNVPQAQSPSNKDYWKVYSPMGDYLSKLTTTGITQAVQRFLQEKTLRNETRALLERRTFFDGAGRINATIQKRGRVVGLEITPVRSIGVTTQLMRIGLQFLTDESFNLPVYLFHSSSSEPIAQTTCYYNNTNGTFQWFDLEEFYMAYYSGMGQNAGGTWYICYYEGDLPVTAEAINMSKDWSKEPCSTCGITNIRAWRELTKYIQISPFCVDVEEVWGENPALWDIARNIYTATTNYGINCMVTIACDITQFIIDQRDVFKDVIEKQVAYNVLRTLAMNPDVKVNRNQANVTRLDIIYELDGDSRGRKSGLGYDLDKAYEALRIDTQDMDRVCLTCNNYGVKYTTA